MSMRYLGGFISATNNPLLQCSAPTIGSASAGNGQATVAFTAPDSGTPTSYTVVSSGGQSASGSASPITVTGLTNGTAYTFTVFANNAYGPSAASAASNSVTPTANVISTSSLAASVGNGDDGSRYRYYSTSVSGGNGVFPIGSSVQFSFEYFLYMTANPGGASSACAPCGDGAENDTRVGEAGIGGFGYSGSNLTSMGTGVQYYSGASVSVSIGQNQWYHVLWTRDSGGTTRMFVDGVLKGTVGAYSYGPTSSISISRQWGNGGYPFSGYVSNVRSCVGSIPTSYQTSATSAGTTVFTVPNEVLTTTSQGATAADVQLLVLTDVSNPLTDYSGKGRNLSLVGSGGSTMSTTSFDPFP